MTTDNADRLAEQIKREFGRRGLLDVETAHGLVDQLAALAKQQTTPELPHDIPGVRAAGIMIPPLAAIAATGEKP